MSGLSPRAREVLELGKDAGEPDDASLARGRAAILRRVGVSALAVATTTSASTAAATTSAVVAKGVPLSTAAVAGTVASPVAAPLIATPFLVKLTAVIVLAVGVGAGSVALRTPSAQKAPSAQELGGNRAPPVEAPPSRSTAESVPGGAKGTGEREAPSSPGERVASAPIEAKASLASPGSPHAATSRAVTDEGVAAPPHTMTPATEASAAANLARDVTSLREAQAALVAGEPSLALAAAERVSPNGPLSEEREGIRVLAGCALGTSLARSQAEDFVQRRPLAPLALRVRAACFGEK